MSDPPPGWKSVTLNELTSPERSTVRARESGYPYLGLEHVEARSTTVVGTGDSTAIKSSVKPFAPGDTLYARLRPYLNKVCAPDFEGVASTEFLVFAPRPWLATRFLLYLFNSPTFVAFANHNAEGIERPRISWPRMGGFSTALPPLNEQRRIVAAIEEHLSRLDAADASLVAALRRLELLRTAALTAVVNGSWPVVSLGDIAHTTSGGTPSRKRPDYYGGDIPWVKSGELGDGRVSTTEETITELGLAESSAKVFPRGTLLIALYGATVGKLGLLEIDAATNQAVCAITPNETVDVSYLWHVLRQKRRSLVAAGQGGAQPNISQAIVRRVSVPLPPLEEQRRIVQEVDERLSRIDAMRASIEQAQRRSAGLRAAILERAFRGELVPQDPADEPADALLARIRPVRPG